MSNVPYTFANNTGNIPLSELDANFSNVKASVDYAATANQAVIANQAYTVITPIQGNITSVGTLTNLTVDGTISTAGNVVGSYFFGDGSQLTNLPSLNYSNANVQSYLPTYTGNLAGALISVAGNATAGNIVTAGIISATGNATAGNIITLGIISATGNATAGNIITLGIMSATGNATAGNIVTAGIISATGNVTGGNISATSNVTGGNISATGNIITNSYILGNVALANGLPVTYSDSNVVSLLSAFGSNVINTTGNIYGGNTSITGEFGVIGNISATGNISSFNLVAPNDGGIDSGPTTVYGAGYITFPTLGSGAQIQIGYIPLYGDGIAISTSNIFAGTSYLTNEQLIVEYCNPINATISSNLSVGGLENIQNSNWIEVTSSNTYSLSSLTSTNLLRANNTGYTATINMPTAPINGQICKFTVAGNAITLVVGTGTVSPSFAGGRSPGVGFKYIYNGDDGYWYQTV